jgi:hypothetical protein
VEVIRAALAARDFSHDAVEAIAAARRLSTRKVYEGKWRVLQSWCKTRKLPSLALTMPQLAEFFLWLFRVKNLAPGTIKGYRSMIADTYRHLGHADPGACKDLSDLIGHFELQRPVVRSLLPRWDLPWVLTWLNSARFEPLPLASLADVARKTCFLLALATAARVSELHALSVNPDCLQFRADGSVQLLTNPAFIAKNRLPAVGAQTINLLPLKGVDRSHISRRQDPVRALKIYLRRSRPYRRGRSRLFLPLYKAKEDISAQTVSSWLRWVIRSAYDDLSPSGAKRLKIRAHEIRAVSTSVALDRNCSVKDIIAAVGWRSDSTFARFYLRDLSVQRRNLSLVGDITVAQQHPPGRGPV